MEQSFPTLGSDLDETKLRSIIKPLSDYDSCELIHHSQSLVSIKVEQVTSDKGIGARKGARIAEEGRVCLATTGRFVEPKAVLGNHSILASVVCLSGWGKRTIKGKGELGNIVTYLLFGGAVLGFEFRTLFLQGRHSLSFEPQL
jgi:hypothetical protein